MNLVNSIPITSLRQRTGDPKSITNPFAAESHPSKEYSKQTLLLQRSRLILLEGKFVGSRTNHNRFIPL